MTEPHYIYKTKPYEKQVEAFMKAYGQEYFALYMEMGTGKTKTTIDIASNLYAEGKINAVLVIAPNGVAEQWINEQLEAHSPVETVPFLWKTKKTKKYLNELNTFIEMKTHKLKWFAVNVETFSSGTSYLKFKEFCKSHDTMVVIDEITRIKNPKSKRFFNIVYGLNDMKKSGRAVVGLEYASKYRLGLTGTAVTNSVYDIWAIHEFLKFNYFGINQYGFRQRYGLEREDFKRGPDGTLDKFQRPIKSLEMKEIRAHYDQGFNLFELSTKFGLPHADIKYIVNNRGNDKPYKHLDELKRLINEDSITIRKSECLDLPDKVYQKMFIEMSADQKRIYKELKDEMLSVYSHKELTIANKMTLYTRLQQVTGGFFPYTEDLDDCYRVDKEPVMIGKKNPKIEALKADIEETYPDEQIIIWSRFTAEIKAIIKELEKAYPDKVIEGYYGEISKEERSHILTEFKAGNVNILVGNSRMGIGLNLQNASITYYFSNSYSLETRLQSEDRTHRGGQTKTCVYKDLMIKGSVDEKVFSTLQGHKNLLDYFRSSDIKEMLEDI